MGGWCVSFFMSYFSISFRSILFPNSPVYTTCPPHFPPPPRTSIFFPPAPILSRLFIPLSFCFPHVHTQFKHRTLAAVFSSSLSALPQLTLLDPVLPHQESSTSILPPLYPGISPRTHTQPVPRLRASCEWGSMHRPGVCLSCRGNRVVGIVVWGGHFGMDLSRAIVPIKNVLYVCQIHYIPVITGLRYLYVNCAMGFL